MWRQSGSYLYHLFVFVIVIVELGVIGVLVYVFLNYLSRTIPQSSDSILQITLAATLACTAALSIYILLYQEVSKYLSARAQQQYEFWLQCWCDVIFQGSPPPTESLPQVAITALLDQRNILTGDYAKILERLVHHYNLTEQWVKALHSLRLDTRLSALEALATIALPETLLPVLGELENRHVVIRLSAARAAIRILAAIPDLHAHHGAIVYYAEALTKNTLPSGVLEEILLSSQIAIKPLLECLFKKPELQPNLLRAMIMVVGHMRFVDMGKDILQYINHPVPAVQAMVLQVLAKLGYLPVEVIPSVIELVNSDDVEVSLQAVRALALLPFSEARVPLWNTLNYPNWDVQSAVIYTLLQYGTEGTEEMKRAAKNHPDKKVRIFAEQFLKDTQLHADTRVQEWLWMLT